MEITAKPILQEKHFSILKKILTFLIGGFVLFSFNNIFTLDPFNKPSSPLVTSSFNCAPSTNLDAIQPVSSGNWNDPGIWPGGNLPMSNDDVTIPQGRTVTLAGMCRAKSIRVNGILNASNQAIDLETESIVVSGTFEIGTASQPYTATGRCLITLTGNDSNSDNPTHKAIMVLQGGSLELHGKKRKSWTNIATTANSGSTQITLKEPVEWEIGDKIALTSTGLASGQQTKVWNNVDESEITGISSDKKTFTLKDPLKYKHIGGSKSYTRPTDGKTWDVDIFGEVGLLSHYIKINGKMDGSNEQDGFGGHIMLMKNSKAHVNHVELYKMGQKGILGRYPFHWHLNEDKAQGSYLKNSSVHKSFNRAVTIHGTDYVTVDGVFAYDHIGHGIFLEDGGERYNTIKNNVVFLSKRPKQGEELTPSDNERYEAQNRTPSSYWITNPNNYFENNVAAGTEGTGFWFAFPTNGPMFDSGNLPYFDGIIPWKEPLGSFNGFVAHTCMSGFDVFDQLNDNHSIKRNFGWDINTEQYIENGLFYGNDQAIYCGLGVGGDATKVVFRDCTFSDNKTITMLAADLTIQNSLFNVDTDLGVFTGIREFYRFYDGPGRHFDCHFEGWNRSNSTMLKQIVGGGATPNINTTYRRTTKGFSTPFPFRYAPITNANERPRKFGQFFKDYDGSLLGNPGTLVRDIPFNRDGHEYRHPSWKYAARSDYFFATIWLHQMNGTAPAVSILRTKPGTDDACAYDKGENSGTYKAPLIVNEEFKYTYYLSKIPTSKQIHIIMDGGDPGDVVTTVYKGLGKLSGFKVSGSNIKELTSTAAVETSTDLAYFIAENGDVFIKMKANTPRVRTNVFLKWNGNGSYQTTPLPCTTNDLTPGDTNNENTAPTASFISPSDTQFVEGHDLGVVVDAFDIDGSITNVKLYIDDILVRQEGVAPYEWGTANPGQNDTSLLNLAIGTYVLKAVATDNNGASTTTTMTITVTESTLSVDDIEDSNTILIYPNPVKNKLFLSVNTANKMVKIYDILGRVKIIKKLTEGENIINIKDFSSGLYLVKILDTSNIKENNKVYKILKID